MPRRKPGTLLALESEILATALTMRRDGEPAFHGFALARRLRDERGSRSLTAHGTLYKALGRLEGFGLLTSRWEDGDVEGRPRRRLYELSGRGAETAERALAERRAKPSPHAATASRPVGRPA